MGERHARLQRSGACADVVHVETDVRETPCVNHI